MSEIGTEENQHGNFEMDISELVKQIFFEQLRGKKNVNFFPSNQNLQSSINKKGTLITIYMTFCF